MLRLAAFATFALLLAQDTIIRVSTRLVQVNVVVRDSHGPIIGLTKADFKIFDKKKEQQIALFTAPSASAPKTDSPAKPIPPGVFTNRANPHQDAPVSATVLLIDALNTEIPDQQEAQKQILKFLDSLDLNRRVAIYFLNNHDLRVLQDFTDDPAVLKKAVARFHGEPSAVLAATRVECLGSLCEAIYEMRDLANVERVYLTLSALSQIANHLAQVPGRKSLLWISSSFPSFLFHHTSDPFQQGRENRTFQVELTRATRALSAADVAIYPVDDRGLLARPDVDIRRGGRTGSSFSSQNGRLAGTPSNDTPEGLDSMRDLADGTGGVAFVNSNDIKGALARAMSDADGSYTLAFYADPSTIDETFHEIKVKVDRPRVEVRARKGYFAESRKPPTEPDVAAILHQAAASSLDATAIGLIAAMDNSRVALHVTFTDLSLEKENGKWTGAVDLAYISESADGRTLGTITKKITFDLTEADYNAKRHEGLLLEQILDQNPVPARIRIAILDERSGATGSLTVTPRK